MPKHSYSTNRPFHLGRRDVFYATAVETMQRSMNEFSDRRLRYALDSAIYCLNSAREHAGLAHLAPHAPTAEKPFLTLLEMLLARLLAGKLLLQAGRQWTREASPIRQFLANQDQPAGIPASLFQTSIPELFREALAFTRAAEVPLRNLHAECLKNFADDDRARYDKAADSLRAHLADTSDQPRPTSFAQTAYPILEMIDG